MTELKACRLEKKLTQAEVSSRLGVSLRSYISYENDAAKQRTLKYRFLLQELQKLNPLDEEHGILSLKDIQTVCNNVFSEYSVDFCYLFGSYAKGTATETSDVDLLISTNTTGLRYYELTERLREALHKKVDLLETKQLLNNEYLLKEVLKEGIRIYG
ncbi:MAG: nucleotidyltransferase domain-containing protein [Lachnospiraceae bacterium]|nr:nucleotidyltransferase domain-containing protein [Lachnospiraceae bacterium]